MCFCNFIPLVSKGYKCWSPSTKHVFVSMAITFRKSDPFYHEPTDLSLLFVEHGERHSIQDGHEGEREVSNNMRSDLCVLN